MIKNNFSSLKEAITKKGFKINNFRIKNFENPADEKINFFNKIILSELNKKDREGKYRHIDLKI